MDKTIMALGAHHDDIEIRAGGTLAKYARQGAKVVYTVATASPNYNPLPGEAEQGKSYSNQDILKMRRKEAIEGASLLGASSIHFFDYKCCYWYKEGTLQKVFFDGVHCTTDDLRRVEKENPGKEFMVTAHMNNSVISSLADFIIEHGVDIILTHSGDDQHWEHYLTANLALRTVRHLLERGVRIKLFGWEFGGLGTLNYSFAPTRFEDITETIEVKCSTFPLFSSQGIGRNPERAVERAKSRARAYGRLCGFEYAEPFVEFNIDKDDSGTELKLPPAYTVPAVIQGLG